MPRLVGHRSASEHGWQWLVAEDEHGHRRPRPWLIVPLLAATAAIVFAVGLTLRSAGDTSADTPLSGAIFTTTPDGAIVNENVHYGDKRDVYLDGGPPPNAPQTAAGLPDGRYVFQVTDPSGGFLLSEDPAKCRIVRVQDGVIVERVTPSTLGLGLSDSYDPPGPKGPFPCHIDNNPPHPTNPGVRGDSGRHDTNVDVDHGPPAIVVQLMPFADTPNPGNVYKAWITPIGAYQGKGGNLADIPHEVKVKGKFSGFRPDGGFGPPRSEVKTDNFKVKQPPQPPAMLHVRKVHDRNGNGVIDPGEPLISAWIMCITDPTGVTNCYGTPVDVVAEPTGDYEIDEENPAGWVQTCTVVDGTYTASPQDPVVVTVEPGSDHTVTFCNFNPAEITACKFYDFDGDGGQSGPPEVDLAGWPMTLTGTTFEGVPVWPIPQDTEADGCTSFDGLIEGDYTVSEGTPIETNWSHTTPVSVDVSLAPGDSATVEFGNVCLVPFPGGLTMGYWKTHTGLDSPERDSTYDVLNGPGFIFLGIDNAVDASPEQQVDDEAEARALFAAAEASTDNGVLMLKAQLLAAKLNVLKFPGFDLAEFPDGTVVGDVIADADQILDDLANGIPHTKSEIIGVKDLLDAANNNSHTGILVGPSPTPCPYTFAP